MEHDLRALVSDFRQYLLAEMGRGIRNEIRVNPTTTPPQEAGRPEAEGSHWFELAASTRETDDERVESSVEVLEDGRLLHAWQGGRHRAWGVGPAEADLMIVSEMAGASSGARDEVFGGAAGEMLEKMLKHVLGLSGPEVYVLHIQKLHPNQNRDLRSDDVIECGPFLRKQLGSIQPKVVLVLGSQALRAVLHPRMNIVQVRGKWQDWNGVPVMPTFHPNHLLRNTVDKRLTFQDLKIVRARYDAEVGRAS